MRRKEFFTGLFLFACLVPFRLPAQSGLEISTGLRVGIARLEGDIRNPELSPYIAGTIRVAPTPFFSLGAEVGFSELKNSDRPSLKSTIVPLEVDGRVSFLPFSSVSPFAFVGGGGVYWSASEGGRVVVLNGSKQQGLDSFLKTGGGLDIRVNDRVRLQVGGVFRYSLTDALDQRFSGDEKDQVLSAFLGFSYRIPLPRDDRDRDGVPDDLDLAVEVREDADGFLDHDGVPEEGPEALLAILQRGENGGSEDTLAPVLIHKPIRHAEARRSLTVSATIYSAQPLRKTSVLYRPFGSEEWEVAELRPVQGRRYRATVPAAALTSPAFEYAIVALGQDVRSIGYSGLPRRPNRVKVFGNGRMWRYVGGLIGTVGWGTASYLVLRKQQ